MLVGSIPEDWVLCPAGTRDMFAERGGRAVAQRAQACYTMDHRTFCYKKPGSGFVEVQRIFVDTTLVKDWQP